MNFITAEMRAEIKVNGDGEAVLDFNHTTTQKIFCEEIQSHLLEPIDNNNEKELPVEKETNLAALRLKYSHLKTENSVIKKIQFYLKLPILSEMDLGFLKMLVDRNEVIKKLEISPFKPMKKKGSKRKRNCCKPTKSDRVLRRRILNVDKVGKLSAARTTPQAQHTSGEEQENVGKKDAGPDQENEKECREASAESELAAVEDFAPPWGDDETASVLDCGIGGQYAAPGTPVAAAPLAIAPAGPADAAPPFQVNNDWADQTEASNCAVQTAPEVEEPENFGDSNGGGEGQDGRDAVEDFNGINCFELQKQNSPKMRTPDFKNTIDQRDSIEPREKTTTLRRNLHEHQFQDSMATTEEAMSTSRENVIEDLSSVEPTEKTPTLRRNMIKKFGFESTTPTYKSGEISEDKAKRVSLACHMWDFKARATSCLRHTRLSDADFVEIFKFTGPGSSLNILGNIPFSELVSIWRNPLKDSGFLSGHFLTGFEDEQGVHGLNKCHFHHCFKELFRGWEEDLAKFSPPKSVVPSSHNSSKVSKKLFVTDTTKVPCTEENCKKVFISTLGLKKHLKAEHPSSQISKQICPICAKAVVYLEQHKKAIHPDVYRKYCEVCENFVQGNMKLHRNACKKCPYSPCKYKKDIKSRVISHKKKCKYREMFINKVSLAQQQEKPLDLRTPEKTYLDQSPVSPGMTSPAGPPTHCQGDKTQEEELGMRSRLGVTGLEVYPGMMSLAGHSTYPQGDEAQDEDLRMRSRLWVTELEESPVSPGMTNLVGPSTQPQGDEAQEEDLGMRSRSGVTELEESPVSPGMKSFAGPSTYPLGDEPQGDEAQDEDFQMRSRLWVTELEDSPVSPGMTNLVGPSTQSQGNEAQEEDLGMRSRLGATELEESTVSPGINSLVGTQTDPQGGRAQEGDSWMRSRLGVTGLEVESEDWTENQGNNMSGKRVQLDGAGEEQTGGDAFDRSEAGRRGDADTVKVGDPEKRVSAESSLKESLKAPRKKFPYDEVNTDEHYESEYEEDDTDEFTRMRRTIKDREEIKMRNIDSLRKPKLKGNDEMVKAFDDFLKVKYPQYGREDRIETDLPSTIPIYKKIYEEDILATFHELYGPDFNSTWIIDSHTEKNVKFLGEPRLIENSKEPVYFTSKVFDKANEKYDNKETGKQRAQFAGAVVMTMDFIEYHMNSKLGVYGMEPLKNVQTYHQGTKLHIESTNIWSKCNKEKSESIAKNRLLKQYNSPNSEAKKLMAYKEYLSSDKNGEHIKTLLSYAPPEAGIPSDAEWNGIGSSLMGVVQTTSGEYQLLKKIASQVSLNNNV